MKKIMYVKTRTTRFKAVLSLETGSRAICSCKLNICIKEKMVHPPPLSQHCESPTPLSLILLDAFDFIKTRWYRTAIHGKVRLVSATH